MQAVMNDSERDFKHIKEKQREGLEEMMALDRQRCLGPRAGREAGGEGGGDRRTGCPSRCGTRRRMAVVVMDDHGGMQHTVATATSIVRGVGAMVTTTTAAYTSRARPILGATTSVAYTSYACLILGAAAPPMDVTFLHRPDQGR